ncbi:bifunctional riboflavin kinase/FAD synthetase [Anaerococcus tetradius]|uniref:Riboflavin biosynthesis protein n=2 Tax=Anaerococcus tetradius TaxID=33036 RepID=C2CEX9_9FIRM|nr:bifunctional riboflavin kinase/FAD synthetase [Anaerococcus tetradius]EEI83877.1 riboflavin biosynthesis protein RibF [Anaerococcus tetradius ATCC 35098]KWZ76424.1 riboflavin biosynthesis protein RibF [Anaerococcus tetradius]
MTEKIKIYDLNIDLPDLQRKAVSLGNFDGVHLGHQKLMKNNLEISKKYDLEPAVLLFKQNTKLRLKDEKEYMTSLEDKIEILSSIGIHTFCLIDFDEKFMNLSPREFIAEIINKKLNASYIICGKDYRFGKKASGDVDTLEKYEERYNYKTSVVDFEKEDEFNKISSNHLRDLIREGNIKKVNKLLARPYKIKGTIVDGMKRGRTLNFPTANLKLSFNYVLPIDGVYLTRINIDNKSYYALSNVGKNPTFGENSRKVETYILDFDQNIYGENVSIEFLEFFRYDIKFTSREELIEQMNIDKKRAYKYLENLS